MHETTKAVLEELESPGVETLAALRKGAAPALDNAGRISEEVQRLIRRIEAAELAEEDAGIISLLNLVRSKIERALRDVDEARRRTRRAARALREAQGASHELFSADGREPPEHLETVPGRAWGRFVEEDEGE